MRASNIPVGLNYVNIRRRAGVLSDYEIVFLNTLALSDFYLIDDFVQTEIKNFGQIGLQYKSEVYILELLESRNLFRCTDLPVTPTSINGIAYTGSEIEIPFSDIVAILPSEGNAIIYATTNLIKKETPDKYTVNYSVYELWYYLNNCSFPSR